MTARDDAAFLAWVESLGDPGGTVFAAGRPALPAGPDALMCDLAATAERIRAIGPIPRRIRVASTTYRALVERCSVGPGSAGGIEIVIDNDLPMRTVRVEWGDGSETDLDLRSGT